MYYRDENGDWQEIILEPSGDTLPVGSIAQFGGATAPTNWLFCNGQAISRETYAELFSVIGTTYGAGDGSTTFNVPDFIGRVPVGLDEGDTDFDTLGETGGEKKHTLTIDEMPKHSHGVYFQDIGASGTVARVATAGNTTPTSFTGNDQPHNNMQPYTVTNFIIKAKQSVGLVGNVVSDMNAQGDNDVAPTKVIKDYVDKKQTYSTDEIVVGKWIDGKPIYRKVVSVNNIIISKDTSIPTGITNLKDLVSLKGIYKNTDGGTIAAYPLTQNAGTVLGCVYYQGNIGFQGNETYSKAPGRIHIFTLEYTKTTDV